MPVVMGSVRVGMAAAVGMALVIVIELPPYGIVVAVGMAADIGIAVLVEYNPPPVVPSGCPPPL